MSTEIDELEKRVARLENRISAPMVIAGHDPTGEGSAYQPEPAPGSDAEHPPVGYILVPSASTDKIKSDWLVWAWDQGPWQAFMPGSIGLARNKSDYAVSRPIPANEGDSRLAESVAIPVGWRRSERTIFTEPHSWRPLVSNGTCVGAIEPDPSIPWGEGYEAILPSEAVDGDGFLIGSSWIRAISLLTCSERERNEQPWRRRIPATTPTEPARDLSAEVERLEEWQEAGLTASMMWDVIQAMRKALDCDGTTTPVERAERVMQTIDELRATVEMMEADNAGLREEIKQIKALEGSLTEAGLLSIGKTGISVSLGDRVLLAYKATHKLYIREVAG